MTTLGYCDDHVSKSKWCHWVMIQPKNNQNIPFSEICFPFWSFFRNAVLTSLECTVRWGATRRSFSFASRSVLCLAPRQDRRQARDLLSSLTNDFLLLTYVIFGEKSIPLPIKGLGWVHWFLSKRWLGGPKSSKESGSHQKLQGAKFLKNRWASTQ